MPPETTRAGTANNRKGTNSMLKPRGILLGVLAALALSAVAAATASAHEYFAEGSKITGLLDGTSTSGKSILGAEILGTKVEIVSTLSSGTFSIGPNGTSTFTVNFTGLTLEEINSKGELIVLTKCTVQSPFKFTGLDQLLETSGKWLDTFSPPSGSKIFAEFKIIGSECALAKTAAYKMEGSFNAILIKPEEERLLGMIEFNPKEAGSQSLQFGGDPATFESTQSLTLNDGKLWSGR
jgi:hypothetical protein